MKTVLKRSVYLLTIQQKLRILEDNEKVLGSKYENDLY